MRSVFGISASLALMAGLVLAFFVPLSVIMGPDRALQESGFVFNNLWVGITMVVCLVAACAGGWFVHRVSGSTGAVVGLVVAVTLIGLADAAWHQWLMPLQWLASVPQAWYEMLLIAREPLWYDLSLPVLMAIFVWVAGTSRAMEHPSAA